MKPRAIQLVCPAECVHLPDFPLFNVLVDDSIDVNPVFRVMVSVLVALLPLIGSLDVVLTPWPPVSAASVHPDRVCVVAPPVKPEHVPVTGFGFFAAAAMPLGSVAARDVAATSATHTTNRPGRLQ